MNEKITWTPICSCLFCPSEALVFLLLFSFYFTDAWFMIGRDATWTCVIFLFLCCLTQFFFDLGLQGRQFSVYLCHCGQPDVRILLMFSPLDDYNWNIIKSIIASGTWIRVNSCVLHWIFIINYLCFGSFDVFHNFLRFAHCIFSSDYWFIYTTIFCVVVHMNLLAVMTWRWYSSL